MKSKKSSESRRKLLKSIAAGSGAVIAGKSLPENWSRPVIDSVMLPAHARTSIFPSAFVSAGTLPSASLDNGSLLADFADKLVPEAKANSFGPEIPCIINNGNGTVTVDAIILGTIKFQKTVTVGAAKEFMDHCPDITSQNFNGFGLINDANAIILLTTVEVRIDSIDGNATGALFVDGSSEYVIDLPPGPCISGPCSPILPSDRDIKENFTEVDEQEILRKVASLPIETWNYTDREKGVRHIGPMAQDFMASFNVGDSDRHIHMVDANGVNLAAIKALNRKLEEKDSQITELQEQLAEVIKRLEGLS
jgi:hypothetical protein